MRGNHRTQRRLIDQTRSIGRPVPTGIHAIPPLCSFTNTFPTNYLSNLAAMTDDFQEQGLEPDDFEEEQEENYVDSIGVLEILAGPGDFNGRSLI